MAKGNKFVRGVKIAVAVLAVLVMSVWSMILYSDAFIDWWIVPAVTLGVGIATAIHMWKWWIPLTWSESGLFNGMCHSVFAAVLLTFAFFALNNMLADSASERADTAVVTGHFREEHHRHRRVGRRYVANGEVYYTYKLQLKLSDGRTKFVEMPLKNYRRIHDGDSASVVLRDGLFGVPVFDHKALEFRKGNRSDRR
ncbi:hypothetical protein [Duncaniella freteri]|uniref:hypothetical protein n=1 Tax=Duncaniella freteri TaxID=2530391 RepID=UPI0025768389|nr:hypothetical protein [Duncaniella freteri]